MSYISWFEQHSTKHKLIVDKLVLQGLNKEEIKEYIDFEKMVKMEKKFCKKYKNPKLKGVGKKLLKTLIDYGFNQLRLNKLILFVFENNKRAILLYRAFGFKTIQKKQNLVKMELNPLH